MPSSRSPGTSFGRRCAWRRDEPYRSRDVSHALRERQPRAQKPYCRARRCRPATFGKTHGTGRSGPDVAQTSFSGVNGRLIQPQMAAIAAARILLRELDRLVKSGTDFAFESTLSGLGYLPRLRRWKRAGYRIEIVYLTLPSPKLALRRIAARVRQGGHNVPKADVLRRFRRSWNNFESLYRPLADAWTVYDNAGDKPILKDRWP